MASPAVIKAAGLHGDGFWGPVTATLDWCEANYQFSFYIAEMANSFSNLYFIALAALGIRQTWREGLAPSYILGFAMFALVGIGSFAFHASLLHTAQLADELPMIYVVSHGFFVLFDTKPGFYMLEERRSTYLLVAEVLFDVVFTWSYAAVYRNPVYHQCVFAVLIFGMVLRVTYLLRVASKDTAEQHPSSQPHAPLTNGHTKSHSTSTRRVPLLPQHVRAETRHCFTIGPVSFALGFLIWNLDNIFCSTLTRWKRSIGWPLAFLLEGHSWWHILTGYGSYLMITGICYLCVCVKDDYRNWTMEHRYGLPLIKNVEKRTKTA